MAQYNRTGIGAYTYNLVVALTKFSELKLTLIGSDRLRRVDDFLAEHCRVVYAAPSYGQYGYRECWEQFVLPRLLKKLNIEVYHSPNYNLPFLIRASCATVLTQYDASIFVTPRFYKLIHRIEAGYTFRESAAAADGLIFGSNHAKAEFSKFYPREVISKGRVIYAGLPDEVDKVSNSDDLRGLSHRLGIDLKTPYIVAIGSVHPRKNYERLIAALSSKEFSGVNLIICGASAWKWQSVLDAITGHDMVDRVRLTGYVENEELVALLRGAKIMVFPSLYEGFGFPPLEAFRYGIPVCASSSSSIPEVVGDAALLFDPYSIDDMRRQMFRLLTDRDLRVRLRGRGFTRLRHFSWDRCASEHVQSYKDALVRRGT